MKRVLDLKSEPRLVPRYVEARNAHADLLLTDQVTVEETEAWLRVKDVDVLALAEDDEFLGAAVLYPQKGGEIAFFATIPGRGIGPELLRIAEDAARRRALPEVWGWVLRDNQPALRSFEKRGFVRECAVGRVYHGEEREGLLFRKKLI